MALGNGSARARLRISIAFPMPTCASLRKSNGMRPWAGCPSCKESNESSAAVRETGPEGGVEVADTTARDTTGGFNPTRQSEFVPSHRRSWPPSC